MVDYNQCLTPAEAVQRMRVLDDEGLTWVEEPTLAHDYAGHALIAREARTPIQCGENWWGTLDLQHAIDAHASRLRDARRDEDRRRHRLAAGRGARRRARPARVQPPVAGDQRAAAVRSRRRRTGSNTRTGGTTSSASRWRIREGMTDIAGVAGSGVDWNEAAIAPLVR